MQEFFLSIIVHNIAMINFYSISKRIHYDNTIQRTIVASIKPVEMTVLSKKTSPRTINMNFSPFLYSMHALVI